MGAEGATACFDRSPQTCSNHGKFSLQFENSILSDLRYVIRGLAEQCLKDKTV